MDPVTIAFLVKGAITLYQVCRKDSTGPTTDEEMIKATRGRPGLMGIRKTLKASGLRGRKFREAVREAWDEVQIMPDDELLEMIRPPEAEEDDEGNDGIDYDLFG